MPLKEFILLIHKSTYYKRNKVNNVASYFKKPEKGQNKGQTIKKGGNNNKLEIKYRIEIK